MGNTSRREKPGRGQGACLEDSERRLGGEKG